MDSTSHAPATCPAACRAGAHGLYKLSMAVPYALTAALLGLLIYCHLHGEPFRISKEDGLVEWSTILAFCLCGALALTAACAHRRLLRRPQIVLLVVFGLAAFLAVGEELSWGQRIFGLKAPAALLPADHKIVRIGHQSVTAHNLTFELGPVKFSLGGMLFGWPLFILLFLHGVYLPLLLRAGSLRARRLVDRLGLFVPPLHLGILVVAGAIFFHYRAFWHNTDAREYKEMLVPLVYAFVLLHCFFRERSRMNLAVTAGTLLLLAAGLVGSYQLSPAR